MARLLSRRTTQVLLILLALIVLGTVAFLSAVKAYFSIDQSAIILAEELGTWDQIAFDSSRVPIDLKLKHPHVADALPLKADGSKKLSKEEEIKLNDAIINAKHAAEAAKKAGFSNDDGIFIPPARDNSVKAWNATTDPIEKIPRIIHQTWKEKTLPPNWQVVRDECALMHPDYEYMLWTDTDSRQFLVDHYSWFLPTFDAYPYNIQRADAIRYFVLHYYGGIYMDLDVGCMRRLDPLLRFEVILPKTIPVGVSNDVMASAKEHPFMDHLIHNLVTFNHRYLTHYPTVMFSTGPMFVSASYGLYVDAHGLAKPSTPADPSAGFTGIRVLPKSLYGKNAKPSDAPNAFFRHYYGSSWHADDAGFLIFLRDNGKLLILIGALIVVYGFTRGMLPRMLGGVGEGSGDRRSSRGPRRGRWIPLPFIRDPRSGRFQPVPTHIPGSGSSSKHRGKTLSDESTQTGMYSSDAVAAATSLSGAQGVPSSAVRVAAPRPQRLSMPLFQLRDGEMVPYTDEEEDMDLGPGLNAEGLSEASPTGLLGRMWDNFSNGGSRPGSAEPADYAGSGKTDLMRRGSASKEKGKGSNVFYLPAYFVGGGSSSSGSASASSTTDSTMTMSRILEEDNAPSVTTPSFDPSQNFWNSTKPHTRHASVSASKGFGNWAASFLPSGSTMANTMRGASPTLQSMVGSINNLSGRTPSPTLNLSGISHALHSNRVVEDLESSSLRPGRAAATSSRLESSSSPLSLSSSREASSRYLSSARQSIDAERPPPPYDQPQ